MKLNRYATRLNFFNLIIFLTNTNRVAFAPIMFWESVAEFVSDFCEHGDPVFALFNSATSSEVLTLPVGAESISPFVQVPFWEVLFGDFEPLAARLGNLVLQMYDMISDCEVFFGLVGLTALELEALWKFELAITSSDEILSSCCRSVVFVSLTLLLSILILLLFVRLLLLFEFSVTSTLLMIGALLSFICSNRLWIELSLLWVIWWLLGFSPLSGLGETFKVDGSDKSRLGRFGVDGNWLLSNASLTLPQVMWCKGADIEAVFVEPPCELLLVCKGNSNSSAGRVGLIHCDVLVTKLT